MRLSDWIKRSGGRVIVAKRLGVTPQALHYWITGKASPNMKSIVAIIELSGGKVNIIDILADTRPGARRRK